MAGLRLEVVQLAGTCCTLQMFSALPDVSLALASNSNRVIVVGDLICKNDV